MNQELEFPSKDKHNNPALYEIMTQLLRGLLASTFLAILVFLLVVLFSRQADPQPAEKEECPFAQEDYIYWSKKYQLAWCKVTVDGFYCC